MRCSYLQLLCLVSEKYPRIIMQKFKLWPSGTVHRSLREMHIFKCPCSVCQESVLFAWCNINVDFWHTAAYFTNIFNRDFLCGFTFLRVKNVPFHLHSSWMTSSFPPAWPIISYSFSFFLFSAHMYFSSQLHTFFLNLDLTILPQIPGYIRMFLTHLTVLRKT